MIRLVISDNEGTTTVVPLARDEVSIGRKEGNTIRLTERNVSRKHCQIERQNGSFMLRDLGSYNGVLLNGQRVSGESAVKEGDEIRVGDYTLHLEAEKPAQVESPTAPPPVEKARTPQPARLVVLTEPVAGAEFVLPENGEVRIGRAQELEVSIDHRSVSREHAKISCANGEVRIADLGSVNGLVINRAKVSEAPLKPGDVVELGDVLVRFVGQDEQYVFDPADARLLRAPRTLFVQKSHLLAAGIVGAALVFAVAIVNGGRKKPATSEPPAASAPVVTSKPAAQAVKVDRFPELLDACRKAISGGRFAEAMAHATAALKEKPDAPDALDCQRLARADHEQEQIYVRGKAAALGGDMEGAWNELSALSATSLVGQRPEVVQEVAAVAAARLQEAQRLVPAEPDRAVTVVRGLLAADGLPPQIVAQAEALLADVDKQTNAKTARAEAAVQRRAAAEPRPRTRTAAAAPAPLPAELRAPAVEKISPMEAASACLARGDNPCVVRALNGRTQTAQELGLLIETFRALGDSTQAYRNMMTYVQRFPTARRAEAYRQMLERQGL